MFLSCYSIETFTFNGGQKYVDFDRRKVEMEISAPLVTTFVEGSWGSYMIRPAMQGKVFTMAFKE